MKILERFLTRDAPLIALEDWWSGGVHFREFFGFSYPKMFFMKRNGAFLSFRDNEAVGTYLGSMSAWFKENEDNVEVLHQRLVEGLESFRKVRAARYASKQELLGALDEARERFFQGFPSVDVVHWIPILHNDLIREGKQVFSEALIKKIIEWREKEGNVFFNEGVETFYFLLDQIAKQTGWERGMLKYITYEELRRSLADPSSFSRDALVNRQGSAFAYIDGEVVFGLEIEKRLKEQGYCIGQDEIIDAKEIKGIMGNSGFARGVVRIVLDRSQLGSVRCGDVLVAPMTSTWCLPAMEKAVAFVTDEGGVTCHAAIIAREMKKPCIIGTKFATTTLKDGDLVEVDANKGVVRIIDRK